MPTAQLPPSSMKSSSTQGTPMRDRNPPSREHTGGSPAPRSGHHSTHSASTANGPSMAPTTVAAVLAMHAGGANPPMAALESAVADRNVLTGQNAQLWKLIEKQRAGYTQIMKELERVRGERELYRSRLQHLGENTDSMLRGHRDRERREGREGSLRSAASHAHMRNSESGGGSASGQADPRAQVQRAQSDDIAYQRQLHNVNGAEAQPRSPARERQDSQNSLNIPAATSQMSVNYLSASQASSSSNLATSTLETSSATSSSAQLSMPTGSDPRRPQPLPLSARPSPYYESEASSFSIPPGYPNDHLKTATTAAEGGWNNPPSAYPVSSRPVPTPMTGPVTNGDSFSYDDTSSSAHPSNTSKPTTPRSPTSPRDTQPQVIVQSASGTQAEFKADEEAKRYYATMSESPNPSPQSPHGFPNVRAGSASPDRRHVVINEKRSESPLKRSQVAQLELEAEEASEQSESRSGSRATGNGEFLDLEAEDTDSHYEASVDESGRVSVVDSLVSEYDDRDDILNPSRKKRATADDFPLPPGTPPVNHSAEGFAHQQGPQTPLTARSPPETMSELPDGTRSYHHENGVSDPYPTPAPAIPVPAPFMSQVPPSPFSAITPPQPAFRALPLLQSDLPRTTITVSHSTIRPNDRGKDVLSFVIVVDPGNGKQPWRIEKLYSDVLTLDSRVRAAAGKSLGKKLVSLPEGRLWKDHAPAKVDQRKMALEQYLRSVLALPMKNRDEIVAFLTSGVASEAQKPVARAGYKEGYLTKRGKNFGGWKTRYFVLQGPSLEYYESRGGAHLGSILITGAQIGRQQRTADRRDTDEDNEYRHAFLIIEAKRGPGGSHARHVLCAESDEERDSWVDILVRYVTGRYEDDMSGAADSRASISSEALSDAQSTPPRRARNVEIAKGPAVPISQLAPDGRNAKLFQAAPVLHDDASKSAAQPPEHLSSSLPSTSSPLVDDDEDLEVLPVVGQRANSEMGHYSDMADQRAAPRARPPAAASPEQRRKERRRSMNPLRTPAIPERPPTPERDAVLQTPRVDASGKVKISGPMNGTPIPAGYKFGGKDAPPPDAPSSSDRREKAKSRSFWGFGRMQHADKPNLPVHVPRAVFGVSLEESLDVAEIASLPAIVFRCIQYLEAKKADQEEGIYRLSGSSAVIKALKDRFNNEGDVDLLGSDEYWDPHAIAGLLKTFLRELPASILTRDLHLRFLSVIDFVDPQERIAELSQLIAALPIANYSLLRALTAHLILIVQNAHVNKMTMRNVGIVFSPTLGIPAGVFSLMLGEFKRVFNVDGGLEEDDAAEEQDADPERVDFSRRNSKRYSDAAADELLGLSGRTLTAEAAQSDEGEGEGEEYSGNDESGTEGTGDPENESLAESSATHDSSAYASQQDGFLHPGDHSSAGAAGAAHRNKAAVVAAGRGLNIATSDKASRRRSQVMGLPVSPRPSPNSNSPHTPQRLPASPGLVPPSPHTPR
ncbi:RhoGAP-domain-containing protein [Phanerochaete sordida]|uniref:RhoGAP-domain-containing protein n=1 Tax=Phanerochaete sordida TaxID=48140 RepID=A0A9P3LD25_9APHY|nr:RhoGAP-domain-containing protein [Phanerochaete sordida]